MRKIQIVFLILLSSIFLTNVATAQSKPLACQGDAAAGLLFENGRWVTRTFQLDRFILVQDRDTLTTDSVGKAFDTNPASISCRSLYPNITCSNMTGRTLFFSPLTLKGSIAVQFGSIMTNDVRDTVTVQVFSCTAF